MTRDLPMRAFELFDRALQVPVEARSGWVAEQAGGDEVLAAEVLALLSAHEQDGVLDRALPNSNPYVPGGIEDAERARGLIESVDRRVVTALSGRYDQIVRIGLGGMALVYRARERKHNRSVVLKVLRPDRAAWRGEERFLRETQVASRLTHPYILPFLDSGRADELLYYVMPHVDGETLEALLRKGGALSPRVVTPLLCDVAEALAYAHGEGLVHRDLKPGNVLCSGTHAYLMDFGIAKALAGDTSDEGLTRVGDSPGTPRYMAPEQRLSGRVIGSPADVYAWGQMAHEALTGTLVSSSGVEPTVVPSRLELQVPDLPAEWRTLIGRALSTDPDERPPADELVRVGRAATAAQRRGGGRSSTRWGVVTALAAGIALLAVVLNGRPGALAPEAASTPSDERRLAVAEFRNETGDPELAVLGRMAGDWLTQGLQELDGLTVVPWPLVQDMIARESDNALADPVQILRAETGATIVVTGRLYRVDGQVSFTADVLDTGSLRTLVSIRPVAAPLAEPGTAVMELRERVLGTVSALFGDAGQQRPTVVLSAPTLDAYRLYDAGRSQHHAQEYRAALDLLLAAHERDTTFLPALVAGLASANNTGQVEVRDSIVTYLNSRRGRLARLDELTIDRYLAQRNDDGFAQLAALREASELAPATGSSYNLALMANGLNRPSEALAALSKLDPDRGWARNWAQYWTQKTHGLHLLGRHDEEVTAAHEMVRRHPQRTVAPVLLARSLAAAGRLEELDDALAESAVRPPRTLWSHGAALVTAGREVIAHHREQDGQRYLREAEEWLTTQLEEDADYANHLEWLGDAYTAQGRLDEARATFERLIVLAPTRTAHRGNAAVLAARLGDHAAPAQLLDHATWPGTQSTYHVHSARVAAVTGDFDAALAHMSDALARGIESFGWLHITAHHELQLMQQDPRLARLLQPIGRVD